MGRRDRMGLGCWRSRRRSGMAWLRLSSGSCLKLMFDVLL